MSQTIAGIDLREQIDNSNVISHILYNAYYTDKDDVTFNYYESDHLALMALKRFVKKTDRSVSLRFSPESEDVERGWDIVIDSELLSNGVHNNIAPAIATALHNYFMTLK